MPATATRGPYIEETEFTHEFSVSLHALICYDCHRLHSRGTVIFDTLTSMTHLLVFFPNLLNIHSDWEKNCEVLRHSSDSTL